MKFFPSPSGQCVSAAAFLPPVLALLVASLAPIQVQAGQFSVSPLRIYMSLRDRATAITLMNEGDTEVVIQADLYDWKQKPDGSDDLTLTEDLILAPPIIRLLPGARQVVRLAMLRPLPRDVQSTYRLIVREIPEAQPKTEGLTLQIAMAFSLPVFISPPGTLRQLHCAGERIDPRRLLAQCENRGKAYAQTVEIQLKDASGKRIAGSEVPAYVLPGIRRGFELAVPAGESLPSGPMQLLVRQDNGTIDTFDVSLPD